MSPDSGPAPETSSDGHKKSHPGDRIGEALKHAPALIAALAAFFTAVAAIRKPPDTTASRAGYEELTKVIEQLTTQAKADHDQIIALRAHVEAVEVLTGMRRRSGQPGSLTQRQPEARPSAKPNPAAETGGRTTPEKQAPEKQAPEKQAGPGPSPSPPVTQDAPQAATPSPEGAPPLPPLAPGTGEVRIAQPRDFGRVVLDAKQAKEK